MQGLETETEIFRDRDETWDLRDKDRDSKKRVSRHVSRTRPSLETPSLILYQDWDARQYFWNRSGLVEIAVACRWGANGTPASGIQGQRPGTSKEWNYKSWNVV